MENFLSEVDKRNLVQELSEGRELANQLHMHLLQSPSSPEASQVLVNEILTSFEQALSMINHGCRGAVGGGVADPPPQSLTGSPPTDVSDHESKDQANRKRRWTRKVEVCGEIARIEGQLDDGYGWRKYGQKDILGANYPRGYYRCTHRYGQGCLATKQIQRSDDDPNILNITYTGIHTCDPAGNPSPGDPTIPIINPQTQLETLSLHQDNHQFLPQSQQPFFDVQTSLKVVPQDLHTLNFPSSSTMQHQDFTTSNHGQVTRNMHISESEAGVIVATSTTSGIHCSTLDVDFPIGLPYEFGSNFGFEHFRE